MIFGLLIFFQQVVASFSSIVAKDITQFQNPNLVLFLRALIAGLVYFVWILIYRKYQIKIEKKDYIKLIILGLINIPINQFLFFQAVQRTTPPNVSLAYALTPVFVFIIAIVYFKEKITLFKTLGIIVAIIGTIVLISEKGLKFSSEGFVGDILALLASLSWAFYTIIGKKMSEKYEPVYITALAMIIGFLLYLPIFLFMDIDINFSSFSTLNWIEVLYLGIFTSAVGYAIWYYALTKIDASKLSVFNNFQPALTAILSLLILGTPITMQFFVGGTLIVAGVFLTQKG